MNESKKDKSKAEKIIHILPQTGFVRLPTVLFFIPVSRSVWWDGVKTGRFPASVKLSEKCTAWRVESIRDLIASIGGSTVEV